MVNSNANALGIIFPNSYDGLVPELVTERLKMCIRDRGRTARDEVETAREKIAHLLHVKAKEIYFTSGGTEADNWALQMAAAAGARTGKKHIIVSAIEHHAVCLLYTSRCV